MVIYGGAHFSTTDEEERRLKEEWANVDPENAQPVYQSLREKVEFEYGYPDSFFIVGIYVRFDGGDSCTARFEQGMKDRPMPALVTSVRGSTLESEIGQCQSTINDIYLKSGAFLFLGPMESLTVSPMFPDLYLDEEYRSEIDRQLKIKGIELPPEWMRNIPVTPMNYVERYGNRRQN